MNTSDLPFQTLSIADAGAEIAPDGSAVRPLLRFPSGSMACFEFASGQVTAAVMHPDLEELWYVIDGSGELWRHHGDLQSIVSLNAGICVSIPRETAFQCRAGNLGMRVIAVTLPAWSGSEAARSVEGCW